MFQWFIKCKEVWIQHGPQRDKSLSTLSEDFFDAVTIILEASKKALVGIQPFLYSLGHLVNDPRLCIVIRKEAVCALNKILKEFALSPEKEKVLTSQEASDMMSEMAAQIMHCGDYDFQVSLIEVLFRMTTADQKKKLPAVWFSLAQVACAFGQIHPLEFEADCRTFLNFVNGLQGDNRRVKSYPCLEVFLGNVKLLKPADDNPDKFWIDFNLGSQSISFYFSCADEKSQTGYWESICIPENEIHSYSVTEKGMKQILHLQLSAVIMAGSVKGSNIFISFCSTLDILQTVRCIYGQGKIKSTFGKRSTVNMTLNIDIEENKSQQNLVPETQVSQDNDDKSSLSYLGIEQPTSLESAANMMLSGLTTLSNDCSKGDIHKLNISAENKGKPSLEMFCVSDRKKNANLAKQKTTDEISKCVRTKQSIPVLREPERMQTGQDIEQFQDHSFVPDTQPLIERNTCQRNKLSISEIPKRPPQKSNLLPNSGQSSNVAKKQECLQSAQTVAGLSKQKHLNGKHTHHPQQAVREKKSRFATKGSATATSFMISNEKGSKEKTPRGSDDFELHLPKELEAQGKRLDKTIDRGKQSLVATSTEASKTNQEKNSNDKRATEFVGNMVKRISSYYSKNNNKNGGEPQRWIPPNVSSLLFTSEKNAQAKDVTKFHKKMFLNLALMSHSVSGERARHSLAILPHQAKEKRDGKKHLFSRDNINSPDVRTLKESSKKTKVKMTYAQNEPVTSKRFQPHNSTHFPISAMVDKSPVVPKSIPKPRKRNSRLNKKPMEFQKDIPQPDSPFNVNKRPRRSATLAKSYKEPATDESLSASEQPQVTKACKSIQPNKSNATKVHAQQQISKCPCPVRKTSPSSIKKMRLPELSTQSPQLDFSPLVRLPPGFSPKEKSVIQPSSLPLSFSPFLTPINLSPITDLPQSHFPGATTNPDVNCSFSEESSISQVSLNLSFTIGVQQRAIALQASSPKTEKTAHSNEDSSDTLASGPARKRHNSLSSNIEEKERQKRKCISGLKHHVLFNSFAEKSIEGEVSHEQTNFSMMMNRWEKDGGNGEMDLDDLEFVDVGVNLSNLSPQLKSKLNLQKKNYIKLMEGYYNETMKTVKQHLFSLNKQLNKHRTNKFADVKNVLMKELYNLEQGKAVLNSVDKDLNICMENQKTFFQSYREQGTNSIEVLKRTLGELHSNLEYEEPFFTSQMAHLKKDMRSIQQRLLSTMHKDALESLRRGLRAWILD
ncbi:synaptonemal complex protein 2 isoform X4 [Syngnathus scovelli]|uniref:synaptonemal complex protein 2 isoform X4 n=1 Tax=Syngnathus scovelli TaxID=161590 RepID=UPI00210F272D|nr:uncharacterized protein LOC125987718 isoform X4 [Syngnathus scovelli]